MKTRYNIRKSAPSSPLKVITFPQIVWTTLLRDATHIDAPFTHSTIVKQEEDLTEEGYTAFGKQWKITVFGIASYGCCLAGKASISSTILQGHHSPRVFVQDLCRRYNEEYFSFLSSSPPDGRLRKWSLQRKDKWQSN